MTTTIQIVKGSSFELPFTVYSVWTGDATTSTLADISGATIKFMAKKSLDDPDASALINKSGTVVSGAAGTGKVTFTAADTNSLTDLNLKYEILVKLSGGSSFIRTGRGAFVIDQHVIKILP